MSKHPPATDATPEALVRALARRGPSSNGRESGRTSPDAGPSPKRAMPGSDIPFGMSDSPSGEPLSPIERRRRVARFLESQLPPRLREDLMKALDFGDEEPPRPLIQGR